MENLLNISVQEMEEEEQSPIPSSQDTIMYNTQFQASQTPQLQASQPSQASQASETSSPPRPLPTSPNPRAQARYNLRQMATERPNNNQPRYQGGRGRGAVRYNGMYNGVYNGGERQGTAGGVQGGGTRRNGPERRAKRSEEDATGCIWPRRGRSRSFLIPPTPPF